MIVTGEQLPNRQPGASGYQRWVEGDIYPRPQVVFMPGPARYSDPEDPQTQRHVWDVLERPHIRAYRQTHREVLGQHSARPSQDHITG